MPDFRIRIFSNFLKISWIFCNFLKFLSFFHEFIRFHSSSGVVQSQITASSPYYGYCPWANHAGADQDYSSYSHDSISQLYLATFSRIYSIFSNFSWFFQFFAFFPDPKIGYFRVRFFRNSREFFENFTIFSDRKGFLLDKKQRITFIRWWKKGGMIARMYGNRKNLPGFRVIGGDFPRFCAVFWVFLWFFQFFPDFCDFCGFLRIQKCQILGSKFSGIFVNFLEFFVNFVIFPEFFEDF